MKVLQFIPSVGMNDGGTTTYMQQLTACLGRLCELHVCVLSSDEANVPLECCQIHFLPKSILHLSEMKLTWLQLLDEIQPDVVHINCCWMPQIASVTLWTNEWRNHSRHIAYLSSLVSYPSLHNSHRSSFLVLTPHGMLEPWILHRNYWTKKLPAILLYQRHAVAVCDQIVATAEEERVHLLKLGWNKNITLIQNGIDVKSIPVKTQWKKPSELLFMSRIHPKKGLELLLDAMCEIPSFHLTVAGTGEAAYIEQLKRKVATLCLDSRVSFVGPVYGNAKWKLLRDADTVVLPSYSENYGLIVAEALSSGTPVITTTGTPWQSLSVSHCGWWVRPESQAIAEALKDLAANTAADMQSMGIAARNLAVNDCAIDQKVRNLYQLYLSNCVK